MKKYLFLIGWIIFFPSISVCFSAENVHMISDIKMHGVSSCSGDEKLSYGGLESFLGSFSERMIVTVKSESEYSYPEVQSYVNQKQSEYKNKYIASMKRGKDLVVIEARKLLFDTMTEHTLPFWLNTSWSFNGTTRIPGKGSIACGTFVVYNLQDIGFKIPSKMARQPSENIIKNLVGKKGIKRFSNNVPMKKVEKWILRTGEGIYIVGLDNHVGFIINRNNRVSFFHSNYYAPSLKVVNQDITEKSPLTDSRYRIVGKIFDDRMIKKWIKGKSFPVIYDYFKKKGSSSKDQKIINKVSLFLKNDLKKMKLEYGAPVFIRIFKKENELEVWIKKGNRFRLFKTYPICTYGPESLGPKLKQGDRKAPEGFYFVGRSSLNPFSSYHLAFNIGYPNKYDRFHKRTGGDLMIHGGCISIGCYAMTDRGIEEIYAISTAALRNSQPFFRVHIFPFRMTAENLASYRQSKWYDFWQNLKQGYDFFYQNNHVPPDVDINQGKYVFQ